MDLRLSRTASRSPGPATCRAWRRSSRRPMCARTTRSSSTRSAWPWPNTAGSMMGRFGRRVRRFTLDLLRSGLVHNVASDAHDLDRRPPGLLAGFAAVEAELPAVAGAADWFAGEAAAAILAGEPLP